VARTHPQDGPPWLLWSGWVVHIGFQKSPQHSSGANGSVSREIPASGGGLSGRPRLPAGAARLSAMRVRGGAGAFGPSRGREGGAASNNAWVSPLHVFPTVPCAGVAVPRHHDGVRHGTGITSARGIVEQRD
jgi:hypothetical protein